MIEIVQVTHFSIDVVEFIVLDFIYLRVSLYGEPLLSGALDSQRDYRETTTT